MLFFQEVPFFLIELISAHLVGTGVTVDGRLHIAGFLVAVAQPTVGEGFLVILVDGFLEVLFGLFVLFEPEKRCPHIVVVDGIFWLQANRLLVVLDGRVELFQFVKSCSKVSVVGRYIRIQLNSLPREFGFLLHVPQLALSSALHVIELAVIVRLEPPVAAFDQLLPLFEVHEGIGF